MYVSAINTNSGANCKYPQQRFGGLIKDKSAAAIIKNMSKKDISELKKIEKRLSRTKFWDMKISSTGNKVQEFKFEFIDKNHRHGIITDGIYPYDIHGDTISIYSIIYGQENITRNAVESLKYKSNQRAQIVYDKYLQNLEMLRCRRYNLTPLESIKSKEIELNMLEESSHFADKDSKVRYINAEFKTKSNVGNDII